jgi:hypothetical protein
MGMRKARGHKNVDHGYTLGSERGGASSPYGKTPGTAPSARVVFGLNPVVTILARIVLQAHENRRKVGEFHI